MDEKNAGMRQTLYATTNEYILFIKISRNDRKKN